MTLRLSDKQKIVSDLNAIASKSSSAAIVQYSGLDVKSMTHIRNKAREHNVFLKVVRNTLARRAVENTEFECMKDAFVGPVFCAFSLDEISSVGRLLKDLSKEYELLKVQALALGGELLPPESLSKVASLPTKDEAISLVMRTAKAPIGKLALAMNDIPTKFVRVLNAVKEQKEAS